MRILWAILCVTALLAGCSGEGADEKAMSDAEVADGSSPASGPGPTDAATQNVTAPEVSAPSRAYINGTIQNLGQCIVWSEGAFGITWHDLEDWMQGASYEATIEAVAGPPPAVVGATGACVAFESGGTLRTHPMEGTIPDGAERVAVLTDAVVDGTFSILIEPQ